MPAAARLTDNHVCPQEEPGPVPHVGGPIVAGCTTVMIGYQPAARVGDQAVCTGPPDAIAKGSVTVKIGGQPAARMGDATEHGGTIATGFPTVMIGDTPQMQVLQAAAAPGVPLCEECSKDGLSTPSGAT